MRHDDTSRGPGNPAGSWRATLDLAGGPLPFVLQVAGSSGRWTGQLCSGVECQPFTSVRQAGDSLVFELADYAASIAAVQRGDSLVGRYHNVGRRGPRTIPFRAARGTPPHAVAPIALVGRWDAWFQSGFDATPRVLLIENVPSGLEGTVISNSGDYGRFAGEMAGDTIRLGHFDGSFVYLLTAQLDGDTLRGIFHAGLRSQTPFVAVRSSGRRHLTPPTEVTRADSSLPFAFAAPDLEGRLVRSTDARFRGKVILLDIFGSWCPTCHDAAPLLAELYRDFHSRGLEIVGLAFEVTGDSTFDAPLVRRYRDKFGLTFPLLLGGTSDVETVEALLPGLVGFTAFPTTVFLGRDGRVRQIHAGFYGAVTGSAHTALLAEFRRVVERLLTEE
ncbi:MAG: TlpA disulfide reductase family protein [Gemmatimonadales bacterium]